MPEDQKSGFSEAVETGASAAHTIRGAIKTGKAISSAAKGAAAGGPYGAVAGAVWAGRKHIGKIIVAVIALLMLPVLFVLMLPGLIFGGLTNAFSPSDPEIPIHNVRVRSIRPCSFPLKWRYGLTKFPIGTPRPQTNVSASLHCFVLDSASWDIAPVSRLNMCVLWKSWIAINRNERRNVNARSRNRYFQVKKCSSHLKPRWINAHKSF